MARQAYIVTDLSFGDAGKGTTVDYLVRQAQSAVVVRHNGGAQAAHNVITPDGRHHTFAQFGSGSFVPGVRTHLSRFMLVNPLNMFPEADHLQSLGVYDIWERVSVDRDALVITPWQQAANRLREIARGAGRHGSCGLGIGETMADSLDHPDLVIRVGDLQSPSLPAKLNALRAYKLKQLKMELGQVDALEEWQELTDSGLIVPLVEIYDEWTQKVRLVGGEYLKHLADQHELLVFEGAQGVLLDEWHGFHPFTTWSTTTPANADKLLEEIGFSEPVTRLGLIRGYTTRHGAGPFVTEDSELGQVIPDYHNGTGEWQGDFRIGHLDLLAHAYARDVCGELDALVVTGIDRMNVLDEWHYADGYRLMVEAPDAGSYFYIGADGVITGIKPGVPGDLNRQARLTELLFSCKPVYRTITAGTPDQQEEFLRTIEGKLGLPISLVSFGPTAADKRPKVAV